MLTLMLTPGLLLAQEQAPGARPARCGRKPSPFETPVPARALGQETRVKRTAARTARYTRDNLDSDLGSESTTSSSAGDGGGSSSEDWGGGGAAGGGRGRAARHVSSGSSTFESEGAGSDSDDESNEVCVRGVSCRTPPAVLHLEKKLFSPRAVPPPFSSPAAR